jgi:integrase/recombinase XerD
MNHRPQVLNFSSALNGFLQYKLAEGLSPATVFNYERDLKLWLEHMGDQDIGRITSANLLEFLNYLRSEYVPRRIAGGEERKLSDKTIYNFYVSLSAFFTWAEWNLR